MALAVGWAAGESGIDGRRGTGCDRARSRHCTRQAIGRVPPTWRSTLRVRRHRRRIDRCRFFAAGRELTFT
jgi:hypothetical protein